MGEYHAKQMKAMRECQLAGVHSLKAQVTQALSDWRVDLSSRQLLLGMVPSTSLYNSVVADLRTQTYEMANKVKQAEVAYTEGKKSTLKALEKMKKRHWTSWRYCPARPLIDSWMRWLQLFMNALAPPWRLSLSWPQLLG